MDHLSSCYFCGAALDEPLGAYTVESSDGEQSVTLCASCRHKLDRLLDATGIGKTVPAKIDGASPAEPAPGNDDSETGGDHETEEPAIGEHEPKELLEETGNDAANEETDILKLDEQAETATAESSESTDEWEPDPEEWGDSVESATKQTDPDADARSPEPVTTNPEEGPGDEETKEIPGLATDDDSPASDWETDIQTEMQPDIPDEFAEGEPESETDKSAESRIADESGPAQSEPTDAEDGPESATVPSEEPGDEDDPTETESLEASSEEPDFDALAEESSETASAEDSGATENPEQSDPQGEPKSEPVDDDDPLATLDETESHTDSPDEAEQPPSGEGGIDPSILQADEIATGNVDIEEVLDGEIEISDNLAPDSGQQGESASGEDEPDDDQPQGEPEMNGEEAVDPEQMDTEDPFDLDTGADESGTTEDINLGRQESGESASETSDAETDPDDGGFDFDNDPGTSPGEDGELQSEMEADIPEELQAGSGSVSDDPMNAVEDDLEALDEMASGTDSEETTEAKPHDEEVAFGDEPTSETISDEPTSEEGPDLDSDRDVSDSAGAGMDNTTPADVSVSDEADGSSDQRRSISALEYNKVMRLLQNREFPVDRMELMAVAASTYDLTETDCAEVLDIAIDRGLLAEDGNKLVKPD